MSAVVAVIALVVILGGAAFAARHFHNIAAEAAANPVLALSPDARRLDEALQREPCDRTKIVELMNLLRRAGENRDAVRRADGFLARCGEHQRVRWIKAEALDNLSQWPAAIAEWTRMIAAEPSNESLIFWRGVTYDHSGDSARALSDYQSALALSPRINSVPFNLATLYERLHRPCDAIFPLEQFIYYNPRVSNAVDIQARIARLYARSECREMAGSGRATVRRSHGREVLRADVSINGHPAGQFAVDTGASLVALSSATATRLGVPFTNWPTVIAQTAGGRHPARLGWVDELEVQGVRARHVQVAVLDDLGDLDGLLGLSFLARFTVVFDPDGDSVEISARLN